MARHALAAGIQIGEFEILRVLGVGGYGIVYLARDHALDRNVALKEYMPASLASRDVGAQVRVCCPSLTRSYAFGLNAFVNEARLLARFDHPSLVKVHRFWEENGTAYMVMPYLDGVMLSDVRRTMSSPPDEGWIRRVVDSILSALEMLHREGVYHRDIAPDNILLPGEGPPILLDFGAARHSIGDTQSFTTTLRLDYAPIEQFAGVKQRHQGPWTDLYALGAVMHFLVFGTPPAPATERVVAEGDIVITADRSAPGISAQLLEVMHWALAIWPNRRPRSAKELRDALDGRIVVPASERRRIASPAGSPFAPAGETPTSMARGSGMPTRPWPGLLGVKGAADWTNLYSLLRQRSSIGVGARLRGSPWPAASSSLPPPLSAPVLPARGTPRAHTRPHLKLALSLLGILVVVGAIAYRTPVEQRDAGLVPISLPAEIVALAPPAQTTSSERLAMMTGVVEGSGAAAALPARPEPAVVSPPINPARASARVSSSARKAVRISSAARVRHAPSARRDALGAARHAKASAKHRSTITVAAVPRARRNPEVITDVPIVTSNAYVERSAHTSPPDRPEGPRTSAGTESQGPSSAQEACSGRGFVARAFCMERECEQQALRDSAECSRVLGIKHARER